MPAKVYITQPVDLTAEFQMRGLHTKNMHVFMGALHRQLISVGEIANLIPKGMRSNRELLAYTITWVHQLLATHNVRLVPDKDQAVHQQRLTAEKRQVSTIRNATPRQDVAPRTQRTADIPMPSVQLEQDEGEYYHDPLSRYNFEVRRYALLSEQEEADLGRQMLERRDNTARNTLIAHNLRLVYWVARQYTWSKLELADLIQEGNLGLMAAADKFDYRVGRFTTYATWWIRQGIVRAIMNQSDVVRVPVYVHTMRRDIFKASTELAAALGRTPGIQEIAAHAQISETKVRRALAAMHLTVSLDEPVGIQKVGGREDTETTVGDTIPDERSVPADVYLEALQELSAAQERLSHTLEVIGHNLALPTRSTAVFRTFYGLDGTGRRRTLEMVGELFGVTRERVRQIIAKIWEKIDAYGSDMDHERFVNELARIDELEKLVRAGAP